MKPNHLSGAFYILNTNQTRGTGIVTGYWLNSGGSIPGRRKFSGYSAKSRPALGPIQNFIHWEPVASSLEGGGKAAGVRN
jgi:hypothetical protein